MLAALAACQVADSQQRGIFLQRPATLTVVIYVDAGHMPAARQPNAVGHAVGGTPVWTPLHGTSVLNAACCWDWLKNEE